MECQSSEGLSLYSVSYWWIFYDEIIKIKKMGNWKGKTRECKVYSASGGKNGMLLVLYTAPKR